MALARTWSVGLAGVQGALVEVEVDLASGVPTVVLVGLPDAVVRQSVDRVRAAVVNTGGEFPARRITIGLSPASMPKQGSGFDLAIAVAVLGAAEAVTPAKRRRLRLLARAWLAEHDHHAPDLRFDVVGVHVMPSGPARVTHLRNAF